MTNQTELSTNVNKMPLKGLTSPKEQAEGLLEGLRRKEEVKEEQGLFLKAVKN